MDMDEVKSSLHVIITDIDSFMLMHISLFTVTTHGSIISVGKV
jgi:hypothetical protein